MAANIVRGILLDQNVRINRLQRRAIGRPDPLEDSTDEELRKRYRFGREGLQKIEDLIGEDLERETLRSQALTPMQQIVTALRFYACGSFQMVNLYLLVTLLLL